MLTKPMWALLNVSDAYYGNSTASTLPHPEAGNATQWGPVVDGLLLPKPPVELLAAGHLAPGVKVWTVSQPPAAFHDEPGGCTASVATPIATC